MKPKSFLDFDCSFKVIEIKGATGGLYIEGMANTIDKDRVGDVVIPKAFEKSLPTYMDNPVLLFQHNWDKVVGVVEDAKIVDNGLQIRAKISGANDCEDVRTKIKEGVLRTLSIGYNEKESDYDERSKTKVIKDLELLEISVVTIPANSKAKFKPVDDTQEAVPSEEKGDSQKSLDEKVVKDRVAELLQENESLISGVAKFLQNQLNKGEGSMKTKQNAALEEPKKTEEVEQTEAEKTVKQEGEAVEAESEMTEEEGAVDQEALDKIMSSKDPMVILLRGILGELQMLNEQMAGKKSMKMDAPAKEEEEEEVMEMESEEEITEEKPVKSFKPTATKSIDDMSDEEALMELEKVTAELETIQDA